MRDIAAKTSTENNLWFFFTLLYLFVDYGRPQDILPFIGPLGPGVIIISILAFYLLISGKIRLSGSKQTFLILFFIGLLAIHVPIARNNYYAYITTRLMLLFIPFILSIIIVVNSIERLKKIISINIILMFYISLYAYFHHGIGGSHYFHDENDFALYINAILPFCFYSFLYEKKKIKKTAYAIVAIIGVLSIVVSFSRGGFIGLVAIALFAWLFSGKKLKSLIVISLLSVLLYVYTGPEYRKEMSTITDTKSGTIHGRILTWESAWRMFLDNPLGVGGSNFPVRFPEYQSPEFKRDMWGRVAHSLWFQLISELGVPGILIYFALLYYNLKDIFFLRKLKHYDDPDLRYLYYLSLAFIASFAGFFASGTGLSVLYYPHYWYLTGILVAMKKIANTILTEQTMHKL